MIKAIDLRIGNWIISNTEDNQTNGINNYVQVFGLEKNRIKHEQGNGVYDESMFDPIPLTREILLKSGLEQVGQRNIFNKVPLVGFNYDLNTFKVMVYHPGNTLAHRLLTDIRHVHQLQNFFYCLIGYDLVIEF
ncbi:MAG: hypothetical protein ACR2KX_03790 [Chitinophagaceae bacterium]|jgi:hypothetical protein